MPLNCCAFFNRDANLVIADLTEGSKKVLDFFTAFVEATKTLVGVADAFVDSKALKKAQKSLEEARKILVTSRVGADFLAKFNIPNTTEEMQKFLDKDQDGKLTNQDFILIFEEIKTECQKLIASNPEDKKFVEFVNKFKNKFTQAITILQLAVTEEQRKAGQSVDMARSESLPSLSM